MDSVLLMCKIHSDTVHSSSFVGIDVNLSYSFNEILGKVFETWPYLSLGDLDLTFSVPRFEKCRLNNDEDVRCMFRLVDFYCFKVVEVSISSRSVVGDNMLLSGVTSQSNLSNEVVDSSVSESSNTKVLMGKHWSQFLKGVGQKFTGGADEFRVLLEKYCAECGFKYRLMKNCKECIVAVCLGKGSKECCWRVKATFDKASKSFVLRKFVNVHECDLEVIKQKGMNLSSKVISQLIESKVRENPTMSASVVIEHLDQEYGFMTTYKKAYKAVKAANERIFGDEAKSFQELRWYIAVAAAQNAGSHIELEVDNATQEFKRLFVAFGACIRGFVYIRPMLFLDGTHLSGKYKGTLLCATGKNGNQGLYPLAFAVVDSETTDNWVWFLEQLRKVVDGERRISFFSDRNLGLLRAVPSVFPRDDHYFCLYHMKENLKLRYNGVLAFKKDRMIDLFSLCAYASTIQLFDKYMDILLKEGGSEIVSFLEGLPVQNWAKAFSVGCRYGQMSSSAVESFNSWILKLRGLPILQMVEGIRSKLMKWHHKRKIESSRWTKILCKGIGDKMCKRMENVRTWGTSRCSMYTFEVRSNLSFMVNVEDRYCSCGQWQIDRFPCDHALACFVRTKDLEIHLYIDKYYFTSEYRKAYEEAIYPVPSSLREQFEPMGVPLIFPPKTKVPPGRPKKKRYKSKEESNKNRKFTCGRCGEQGHSKRSCKKII